MSADWPVKRAGFCTRCGAECYEILAVGADGSVLRVGRQHPHACQVEFTLSDGSEMAVTFCRPCAAAWTPEEAFDVLRTCQRAEAAHGGTALKGRWILARRRTRAEAPPDGSGTKRLRLIASGG